MLDDIVKAYDLRGVVPDQLDSGVAHAVGVAFARFAASDRVLVARDMRPSGIDLVAAFTDGVLEQGVDVVDLGLGSSDLLYFAAGSLDCPGAMFTASHNPAEYNGVKLCLSGARPVGIDSGFREIKVVAESVLAGGGPRSAVARGRRTGTGPAAGVRRPRPVVRRRRAAAPAARGRRHGERNGRTRRAGGV